MSRKYTDRSASRFKKFLTGNGFYLSLAACVVAVGGVAVATFAGNLGDATKSPETPKTSQNAAVNDNVTGVSDTRTTTTTTTKTTTKVTTTTTAKPTKALYVLPLSNVVSKPYSERPAYSKTMQDFRTHTGVDFSGKIGDDVMAITDGTISKIEKDALWGGCITIDHGYGVCSVYRGITATVKKGDTVEAGKVIGTLAAIPCEEADGAHLHLELMTDGETVDPLAVLDKEVKHAEQTTFLPTETRTIRER